MILAAELRCVPTLPYVVFLGVKYCSYVVTAYQRNTYCEYCQYMGQHFIAHTDSVQPRPNY